MALPERLTIRSLYLYLVCLVTLVIALFAAVELTRSTVGLFYPDPGYYGYAVPEDGLSEAERLRQEEIARQSQLRNDVLGVVGSATTLLIAAPLYLYHWRRVQSELLPRDPRPAAPVGESR